jgi:hypothetical protein
MVIVKQNWKTMDKHLKNFKRNFLKLSLIGIIFFISCGREEAQQDDSVEWYTKLGFKKVMEEMKNDTQILTRKLGENNLDEAIELCTKIGKSFNKLDLDNPTIPEEFSEFKQSFDVNLSKLLLACQDKESEAIEIRLKAFKKSCHYCHVMFRKELDASDTETDFGVGLERMFKDKKTGNDLP